MGNSGFNKLFWGFLFILLRFKIGGFDVLPDLAGYIFFIIGLNALCSYSLYFEKAKGLNIVMVVLSVFNLYQPGLEGGDSIFLLPAGFGIITAIGGFIVNLILIYNILMGARDICQRQEKYELHDEGRKLWSNFVGLQVMTMLSIVIILIPLINILCIIGVLIYGIVLTVSIMNYMKKCQENLVLL